MDEVGTALIAMTLVLGAVFIPTVFLSGILGQFFRQFAVTIATATFISLLVSLTLSPALCARLFKPHEPYHERKSVISRGIGRFFRRGPWEAAATAVIALGVVLLMQPFSLALYGWSFLVILAGTLGFVVVSHFRD